MLTSDIILFKPSDTDLFTKALSMLNIEYAVTADGVIFDRGALDSAETDLLPLYLSKYMRKIDDPDCVEKKTARNLRNAQQPTIRRIGVYALSAFSGYEFGVDEEDSVCYRYTYGDDYLERWKVCDGYTTDDDGMTTFYLDGDLQVRADRILRI